jgi:hypothetical protein
MNRTSSAVHRPLSLGRLGSMRPLSRAGHRVLLGRAGGGTATHKRRLAQLLFLDAVRISAVTGAISPLP